MFANLVIFVLFTLVWSWFCYINSLREKCLYSELFLSVFSRIRTEHGPVLYLYIAFCFIFGKNKLFPILFLILSTKFSNQKLSSQNEIIFFYIYINVLHENTSLNVQNDPNCSKWSGISNVWYRTAVKLIWITHCHIYLTGSFPGICLNSLTKKLALAVICNCLGTLRTPAKGAIIAVF